MSRHTGQRISLAFIAVLAIGTLSATPAAAQNVPGSWEISPFGGGSFGSHIYDGGDAVVDVATAPTYGARLAYNFTRSMAIEFAWSHADSNLWASSYYHSGPGVKIGTLQTNVYEADFLYHWGSRKANGYIALGLGAMTFSPDIAGFSGSTDTRFTTSFGMGGKFSFSPRVALRIDGRFRATDTDQTTGGGVWCDFYGYCYYYYTTWYNSGEVTGGLVFRF